jgi:hypothetical protein
MQEDALCNSWKLFINAADELWPGISTVYIR